MYFILFYIYKMCVYIWREEKRGRERYRETERGGGEGEEKGEESKHKCLFIYFSELEIDIGTHTC